MKNSIMWVLYISNNMQPEYDDHMYFENFDALQEGLRIKFNCRFEDFKYDELTLTHYHEVNGFVLHANKRPLWKVSN